MNSDEIPAVVHAKDHIRSVIRLLRENDGGYADALQELLDGMTDWYTTKENLFKVGELCHPKVLGDQFIKGFHSFEWTAEILSLRDDCAIAFGELERDSP